MRKLIIVIFLLQLAFTKSQNLTQNSKQEIDSLLELSRNGIFSVDLVSTLENAQKALEESEKLNYSEGKARACYYISNTLLEAGNYEKALEYLSISINEQHTKNTPQLLSDIYRVRGRVYGNMGLTNSSIKEFKKGLESTNHIPVLQNRKYTQSLFFENLIFLHKKKQQMDSVKYYLDQNAIILQSLEEDFIFRNKINYYNELADYYLAMQKFNLTKLNLNNAINTIAKYQYPYKSSTYKIWGDMYLAQDKKDSALTYYFKAIANTKDTRLENETPPIYDKISLIYRERNEIDLAKNYHIQAMEIRQKLANKKIEATEAAFNIMLEENSLEISKTNYLLISTLLIVFLTLISYLIFYFRKKQKKMQENIKNDKFLLLEKDKIIFQKEEEASKLKRKVNESFDEIVQLAKENNPEFIVRFGEVYPVFYTKIIKIEPALLKTEIKLCAFLFLNFSTKDIAEYTFVTVKAVQHRKFRLRKKLNIPSDVDILNWISD